MRITKSPARRAWLRRVARMPLVSPRLWLRRITFWLGAVLVSVVAIGFAAGADAAGNLFQRAIHGRPLLAFAIAPAGLVISLLLTRRVFPGAQGSGIPQVIAALHMTDETVIARVLNLRLAAGKVLLTLLGLASGASIGREGPRCRSAPRSCMCSDAACGCRAWSCSARWCWPAERRGSRRRLTRRWPG